MKESLRRLRQALVDCGEGDSSDDPSAQITRMRRARIGLDVKDSPVLIKLTKMQRETEITRVDSALARIESGSFGACCHCGLEVETEWLEVDPATPFCRVCIEELTVQRRKLRR